MTYETALAASLDLVRRGVSHTIQVGYHDGYAPEGETEHPAIHCRIDLGYPRRHALPGAVPADPPLSVRLAAIESIARNHGLVLESGMMGDGLTLSTARRTP